jgi:enterobactin synthetase component D
VNGSLTAAPLQLDLGPTVASAGFAVIDHETVIAALAAFDAPGLPVSAVVKRRAEFLAGRFAARQALASIGVEGAAGRNEDGSPRWPAQVVGSITHGAGRALCAVARAGDVRSLGIDAERLMGEGAKRELLARICSEDERALLVRSLDAPEHHLVTFAFSTKESLYKCLYPLVGHFMDFSAARVVAAVGQVDGALVVGELTLELSVDWSTEFRRGQQLQARFIASEQHVESAVLLSA